MSMLELVGSCGWWVSVSINRLVFVIFALSIRMAVSSGSELVIV